MESYRIEEIQKELLDDVVKGTQSVLSDKIDVYENPLVSPLMLMEVINNKAKYLRTIFNDDDSYKNKLHYYIEENNKSYIIESLQYGSGVKIYKIESKYKDN
jgi:hypothetical protein